MSSFPKYSYFVIPTEAKRSGGILFGTNQDPSHSLGMTIYMVWQ